MGKLTHYVIDPIGRDLNHNTALLVREKEKKRTRMDFCEI